MRILLVNAINPSVEVETRYPNLGLGYLVSALRSRFGNNTFDFKIIDRDLEKTILSYKPDILCLTSVTQNYNIAKNYAAIAKIHQIPVIMGGIHISMLPHSLSYDMDVGCIGEGEKTIIELFSSFMNKGKFLNKDLSQIKGIVYREVSELITNQPRELIEDMDKIDFPARDLLRINKHSYMFTSRGCSYSCTFCSSTKFWKKVRFFSAEYVIREIEELIEKYGVKLISFYDDLFIGDLPRLKKIVGLLENKSFLKKVRFTCSARANLINDESVKLLKRMQVFSVGMGLESGSNKTLRYLKGDNISIEDNRRAIAILNKYKISPNASFIIGSPFETKEDMLKTYFFIKNNRLRLFDTYVLTPYPGTYIWKYAKKRNLVSDNMDWSKLNVNFNRNFKKSVILSEVLDRKDIVKMYKKFQLLRLFKNAKNVWFTPQVTDLAKIAFKTVIENLTQMFKKDESTKFYS